MNTRSVSTCTAAAALVLAGLTGCSDDRGASVDAAGTTTATAPAATDAPPRSADTGPPADVADAPSSPAASPRIHFTDVSAKAGIEMQRVCGAEPPEVILDVKGGGMGLIDFDNDGDRDLFIANGATLADTEHGPGSRLYENLGNLRFRDATEDAGINLTRWAMGVAVADIDGDRFDDLYVCCFGANVLYRNNGDGTFADITESAGVAGRADRWSTSAAFGDLDHDGDLDLYVANYVAFDPANPPPPSRFKDIEVMNGPMGLTAHDDVLYENVGDGTFRDVTTSAGVIPTQPAYGLNVAILDLNADHLPDIFVGNDSQPNFLFMNEGDWTFREVGRMSGIASNIDGANQATMGIAIADVDGNATPDVFTTNFSSDTNTLHLNVAGRFFDDRTQRYGLGMVSRTYLGWAAHFADLDHDGDEDLFIVNGHVYPQASMETMDSPYRQTPLLFERDGSRFEVVDAEQAGPWLAEAHVDRTAVWDDLDGDGDLDVIIGSRTGSPRVLRNDVIGEDRRDAGEVRGDWLIVELRDEREGIHNHRGIGAVVELTVGEHTQRRWLRSGGGFQSADPVLAHFALPAPHHKADRDPDAQPTLTITWPDGHVQTVESVALRTRHTIKRES